MLESPGSALRNCDGLAGASNSGDGILRPSRGVDTLGRMEPDWRHSVAYCDRAIANIEQNFPRYWQRRVSLLQSRAIHQLIASDARAALSDVDAADAAVVTADDDYARTLGVNAKLIRAMALVMHGDRDAGETLALEAPEGRPYNRATLLAALMVLAPEGNRARVDALLERLLRLDPRAVDIQSNLQRSGRLPERDLHAFFMLMLDAESADRRGRGWEAGTAINANRCLAREAAGLIDGDRVQLCRFTLTDTPAMAEEAILVGVARIALEHEAASFRIEHRSDVSTWAVSPYSRVNDQSGHEIHVAVTMVPAGIDCEHCLVVDDVINDLGPRYPAPPPPAPRRRL